jgi:hypothetical protein
MRVEGGEPAGPKGMGLAQKMLEKMGWKAGEGLGRNRQVSVRAVVLAHGHVWEGLHSSTSTLPC